MTIGEVIETKTAFKPNQKDEFGNNLPLGAIQISMGGTKTHLGQVTNIYARPAIFNRRIPLIGEQVMVMRAPTNDESTDGAKGSGYIYFNPINATDDLVLHKFRHLFNRDQDRQAPARAKIKHDRDEPGYTFPKVPKKTHNIQPFEGDDIVEGRFGQSLRFGSSVQGDMSVYSEKPSWMGGENTDPLIIMRLKKPAGGGVSKYVIEDLGTDDASIYIATTQMLTKFKAGFKKNMDVKTAGNWSGTSQIVVDAQRVIINAKDDMAFVIGASGVVVTGDRILFQDSTYKVYLDELMDFLKAWLDQDKMLAQGTKMYSTACGPTSVATNLSDYIQLSTADWQKFKMP